MGDVNPSLFLSPAASQGFIWGVGATTTLPTATLDELGRGQWSMGPTAVGLYMKGPWVVGRARQPAVADPCWSDTNVVTPDFGPDWQLRFQLQRLFPR